MTIKQIAVRVALYIVAALALYFVVWLVGAAMHDLAAPRYGWGTILF